jgi:hypothetical protein
VKRKDPSTTVIVHVDLDGDARVFGGTRLGDIERRPAGIELREPGSFSARAPTGQAETHWPQEVQLGTPML